MTAFSGRLILALVAGVIVVLAWLEPAGAQTDISPPPAAAILTEEEATGIARDQEKVGDYLADKPDLTSSADFGADGVWTVSFFSGPDEAARVLVDDISGSVDETMTGPQVAWQMARGYEGAFGRIVNEPYIWVTLCLLFLLPFVDTRRPFTLLNLDLIMLLSFSISHYFFNQGEIQISVPLAYPPLLYLFARLAWIGLRRKHGFPPGAVETETGVSAPRVNFSNRLLIAGLALLIVFRVVINIADSNVVDVGYSGVIGADLIQEGKAPYGNMPADNGNGDTYGPLNYLLYIPFEAVMPWSGEWDALPAAHAAAIFFDLLAMAGMFAAGRLLGRDRDAGNRLGIAFAYGWAAYPYTTFVLNCNVNDTIVAALVIWGFVLLRRLPLAGLMLGFATQIKFFPAILAPLWSSFPYAFRNWWARLLFILAFITGVAVTIPVVFMGDGTLSLFLDRTIRWQIGRDSPFSIWGQYPGSLADIQQVGQYLLVALSFAIYFWPPRKSLVQIAAASAALITGFQMMLTHWFYLYIPWFFPLALVACMASAASKKAASVDISG